MAFTFVKIIAFVLAIVGFGYIIMFNKRFIAKMSESSIFASGLFYKLVGKHLFSLNQKVARNVNLNRQSVFYNVYKYFDDMILNLDLADDGVTVVGLLTFIGCIAIAIATILGFLLDMVGLIPITACALFYLIVVIFRFMSLMRYERREADIMDAEDLLVSDIKGGVYNAIIRYKDSFNPRIRPYFLEFIDDIQRKGYSFKQAMLTLNGKLGHNFTEFAHKAIMYEERADKDMDEIFSPIIEQNRQRRTLRHINNIAFNELRTELIVSMLLIAGYCFFAVVMDKYLAMFLMRSMTGKILIILDIAAVAWVLTYIASIKAKSL